MVRIKVFVLMNKNVFIRVHVRVHVCMCWNVQPLPLNRKGVQLIASPPFPLVQNGGQTRVTLTVNGYDPALNPFHSKIYKAPGQETWNYHYQSLCKQFACYLQDM